MSSAPSRPVQALQPLVGRFVAARVEVVLLLRQDDDGFRSERGEKVFVVQAQRQRLGRDLLHVRAELVLHVSPELGHETTRGRHRPALLEPTQPGRHRPATGIAGDSEVPLVHFVARHQVVEGANAVPRAPRAEALVNEHLLNASVVVLGGSRPARRLPVRVHVLHPLALADGIEDQHDVAEPRQSLAEGLIGLDRLAVRRVPARRDDSRERESSSLGNVEIRRDEEPRTAFEEDVLDLVGVPFDDLGHSWIERSLLRQRAERFADFVPDRPDVGLGVSFRRQGCEPFQALLVDLVLACDEELLNHAGEAVERPEGERVGFRLGSSLGWIAAGLSVERDAGAAR